MVWPFTAWGGADSTGDPINAPDHGPWHGYAPQADAEDITAYHAQGSVCMCWDCKRYRKGH